MKRFFSSAPVIFYLLTIVVLIAYARPQGQPAKTAAFTTASRTVAMQMEGAAGKHAPRGMATLTILRANEDDTVTGDLTVAFTDAERNQIAQFASKPLGSIPAAVVKKEVTAGFRKNTACPTVRLEIGETGVEIAGARASIQRLTLDIAESPAPVPQLFCTWTRQLNARRPRRGVIAALNRLIAPDPAGN